MKRKFTYIQWLLLAAIGLTCGLGSAWAQTAPSSLGSDSPVAGRPLPIRFTLAQAGRVSLAVYDASGVQLRTLLSAKGMEAGPQSISWDGLGRDGRPVPPGSYTWKLLVSQGLKARYLLSVGTSLREKPWPAQHGGLVGVAVDGDRIYTTASMSEGSPQTICLGLDGKPLWYSPTLVGWGGGLDIAADGGRVYFLGSGPTTTLYTQNRNTGEATRLSTPTVPALRASFGGAPTPGVLNEGAQLFTAERSNGWDNIVGLEKWVDAPVGGTTRSGIGGSELSGARHYKVRLPDGIYDVRLTVGRVNPDADAGPGADKTAAWNQDFDVVSGEARAQYLSMAGKPAVQTLTLKAEAKAGLLDLVFQAPKGAKAFSFNLSSLEVWTAPNRMDSHAGAVVVAGVSILQWLGPKDGKLLHQVEMGERIADVALQNAEQALVLSAGRLRLATPAGPGRVLLSGLQAAHRVSVDEVSGDVLVAEGGTSQRIKRFDKSGKLLATYGRAGGRRTGLYVATDFLAVSDIAADGKGGFYVTESDSAPRRLAHFGPDGQLIQEWYGGQQFYTFAAPDPADPNLVWLDSHWGWIMQAEVDWDKGTWKPRATYHWGGNTSRYLVGRYKMAMPHSVFRRTVAGKPQVFLSSGAHSGFIQRVDEAAGLLQPYALLSLLVPDDRWGWKKVPVKDLPASYVDAMRLAGLDPANDGDRTRSRAFSWSDLNGDGLFDANEFQFGGGLSAESMGASRFLDGDLTTYFQAGWNISGKPAIFGVRPRGYAPGGAPIWNWADRKPGPVSPFETIVGMQPDEKNGLYLLGLKGGGDGYIASSTYGGSHGAVWPANQTDTTGLLKFDASGRLLWQVGPHAAQLPNEPGQLQYPSRLAGVVDGYVGVSDKIAQPLEVWDSDGLYVGGLFDRRAADGLPDAVYRWWTSDPSSRNLEAKSPFQYDMNLGGTLFRRPSGQIIYMGSGWNNCPAYEVTGWNEISRQSGALTVAGSVRPASATGTGLSAAYFGGKKLDEDLLTNRLDASLWFDAKRPWPKDVGAAGVRAVRWTGQLEARFSDSYTLGVYGAGGSFKLWLAGKLVCTGASSGFSRSFSPQLNLHAGHKYPLVLEYVAEKGTPEMHLSWYSSSQAVEHIPTAYLYPDAASNTSDQALPVVTLRVVTALTDAGLEKPVPAVAELQLSRPAPRPLTLNLQAKGSAQPGRDYVPLPRVVTIPAGGTTARIALTPVRSVNPAPKRQLTLGLDVGPYHLCDGTAAEVTLSLWDSRRRPVEGVTVTASDSPETASRIVGDVGLDTKFQPWRHDISPDHQWRAIKPYKDGQPWLLFDLGRVVDLDAMRVWSYNLAPGDKSIGPKEVEVWTSSTTPQELKLWRRLTLPKATGLPDYGGDDVPLPLQARYLKFVVQNIYDFPHDTPMVQAGLAKVRFFARVSPTP